jgi:DNA polymerase IV
MLTRKIIHIDMDAFYASVEQRDNPEIKGKPVIVGGDPDSRGVVAACSYEARKFGIHSAMPCSKAARLCKKAVFLRPRFEAYTKISKQIRQIFLEYTDLVEPLSLDEAYLDVTENKKDMSSATLIAEEIRKKIFLVTGLTASAGVSFNKFLAKTASDINKPDGIAVITPDMAEKFIDKLEIGKFFGIGKVTEKKMIETGIKTGADLKKHSREKLITLFGKPGNYYYEISHGLDNRPVTPNRVRKSIGKERTFSEDITDMENIMQILEEISRQVSSSLERHGKEGKTITLKVRYHDFKSITRSVSTEQPAKTPAAILINVKELITKTDVGKTPVRLLGITVSNFERPEHLMKPLQLKLPFMPEK